MSRRILFLLAAISILFASCCEKQAPPASPPEYGILLTGFEPFSGYPFNTSWEVIRNLDETIVSTLRVKSVRLPVVWLDASQQLSYAAEKHRPRIIICFGMGTRTIQLELTAKNERRLYPDEKGLFPKIVYIKPGGPDILPTKLPYQEILSKLKAQNVLCVTSNDAGGFLCNEVFYTCMTIAQERGLRVAGLVHLPVVPPDSQDFPSLASAVRTIIETCASVPAPEPSVSAVR